MPLYDRVLITVDKFGNQLTRDRIREFVKLTGGEATVCFIADARSLAGEVLGGGVGNDAAVSQDQLDQLQEYVDLLAAEGIRTTGQVLKSTEARRGERITALATGLNVDIVILNFEEGGARAKARLAKQILKGNPGMAVLVARPTTGSSS